MDPRAARARTTLVALALTTVAAVAAAPLVSAPATAEAAGTARPGPAGADIRTVGDTVAGLADVTTPVDGNGKTLSFAPSQAQEEAARTLGPDVSVTWNSSGTPASVFRRDGVLARAVPGVSPDQTARDYLVAHADLLGLSVDQVRQLELVSSQPFARSAARAVLFRQKFGDLTPATRSMVTVGVAADGSVTYLSSSLVKASGAPSEPATLTPLQGWLKAASYVGRTGITASAIDVAPGAGDGWTALRVPGFDQPQLARLRAYATSDGTVRPVIEADVVDTTGGSAFAYRVMVDAVDGTMLFRQNAVDNSSDAFPFQGTYTSTACGPTHSFELTDDNTRTITVVAAAVVAADDITIKLTGPGGASLGNFDLLTSPEVATYSPTTGALPAGTYGVAVCPFDNTAIGGPYTATVTTSDTAAGAGLPDPTWRAFAANPPLGSTSSYTGFDPDNSIIECWRPTAGCTTGEAHENLFSFGAWDQLGGAPTLTTIGNNANTHEAWGSALTPGGTEQAPYSPTREYTTTFTDAWNNSKCDPANLVPGGNDINAVVTNLFVGHNRMHDFSYALGFTEENYNLQADNGGRGGQGGDQEIGNVQAGAADTQVFDQTGVATGRNNANQIALQDGVPGITNQYLFQPVAGAFYAPCADGALDTGIYGHEYTHAISNRMVGGPDDGLTSEQGGAMGESWSDLNASEYEFENGYDTGTSPWSLGSYTTGNHQRGIRDYAINDNPLNYSDYGFDTPGPEVHADGEIWNGTLWEVRQALVNKWNAQFPYTNAALQKACAKPISDVTNPPPSSNACPGNRRWLQLIFDAWLLQPGATDMLQARDAMLAADRMRYAGANQEAIASAFARRGMGVDASTPSPDSDDVTPSFQSAYGPNSNVTFTGTGAGKVFVGDYEARVTPVADLDPGTSLPATAKFTPGVYKMTYVSPSRGFRRFILNVPTSGAPVRQPVSDDAANVASAANGASVIGATDGSLNSAALIDGTEGTNWAGVTADNVDVSHPYVTVDLAGGVQTISAAKVSALLHPAPASGSPLPLLAGQAQDPDPTSGSRFTALRQFALQSCTADCASPSATFTTFYTSPADAFPGDIPRPVAPDQTMRTFRFPAVQAAAVRLVALNNQCTGQAKYAGDQDNDPTNDTDCKTGSDRGTIVHAAELQVFAGAIPNDPAPGTPGNGTPGSGTAGQGTNAPPLPGQASLAKPVKTHTRIRLPRVEMVRGKEAARLLFQVVAAQTSGKLKAGKVVVRMDGKVVKKTAMRVTRKHGKQVKGKVYLVPTDLALGAHRFQVFFKPTDKSYYKASKSRKVTLTVVRRR